MCLIGKNQFKGESGKQILACYAENVLSSVFSVEPSE